LNHEEIKEIFLQVAKQYQVKDLVTPSTRVIFLLESPHVHELKFGAPVCGSSGTSMTKHLFGDSIEKRPLGLLLLNEGIELIQNHEDAPIQLSLLDHPKEAPRPPWIHSIGLLNVCQIPMQRTAYGTSTVTKQYEEFFEALEGIRISNQKSLFRNSKWNWLQEVIIEHLSSRLVTLQEMPITWVPCGKFAQKFFRLAHVNSLNWRVIEGVPHPSYNSWDRTSNSSIIDKVRLAVRG
jgi:hypothetical protein